MSGMTNRERQDLASLIRKREKLMKTAAAERASAMMAEFEKQCASIYRFDDDAVWKEAMEKAAAAVKEAEDAIAARCADLGIPRDFAPSISLNWYGRGHNAVAERRTELRRAAKARIDAIEKDALVKIERASLEAQTELMATGIETEAAKLFLEGMKSVDALMPSIDAQEVKQLVEARHEERRRSYGSLQ